MCPSSLKSFLSRFSPSDNGTSTGFQSPLPVLSTSSCPLTSCSYSPHAHSHPDESSSKSMFILKGYQSLAYPTCSILRACLSPEGRSTLMGHALLRFGSSSFDGLRLQS